MRAPKVQVITDKKGIPLVIRDAEPFHIELWRSEEGIEFFDNYYLAFSFRGGLYVEIGQKPVYPPEFSEGAGELYQGSLTLNQLDKETLRKLRNSKSLERIREKFKEIVMLLTENLDSLFFDLIDRHQFCYVCESDALYECIRCNKDVCDQHAVFAETEYEEPLTYCHECFVRIIER
jgi:hypothetical protein